ncbi:hypothetical protein D9X91_22105 [Falsibacillus albus]|uniref:Uncharacterized protein n=1 Tax=Falsibacillus albus TaxID=2478915 RepID=A0A3L7JGQ4_9BACI|nr:hypothetical protein D9X91_22105 [Falsibacillus albus]
MDFIIDVDWSGRCETPEGSADKMRPRSAARRLNTRPSESEHPSAEINHLIICLKKGGGKICLAGRKGWHSR